MKDLVKEIEFNTGHFPREVLEKIMDRKEETIPELLSVVYDIRDNPEKYTTSRYGNYMAHIYSVYLLAQFRVKELYPVFLDILKHPSDILDNLWGDVLMEAGANILASVCCEDIEPIKEVIEDPGVDEYSRGEALQALTILALGDKLPREEVIEYFRHLLTGGLKDQNEHVMAEIVCCCDDLYPQEAYDEIKQAFDQGRVGLGIIGLKDIERTIRRGKERAIAHAKKNPHNQLVNNTIKEMESWPCFYNSRREREQVRVTNKVVQKSYREMLNSKTIVKEVVPGRNDLCSCDSGKKFKKCCGAS
ncbi:DUF1186 domain-containing protein [Aneurinibacillus tyrosinisolvens]|uniref:DUF1186 domain-containing protein n=1 Tax=Aneurinibacillus tyrosinisolvens TaxID=1443435 RepID=UPI00063F9644|nr:DUF1186 domain-containing protein [Aneurinibacillus tyrosinisolvens]